MDCVPRENRHARRTALVLAALAVLAPAGCRRPGAGRASGRGPLRIVSTAPSVTETLFALGLGPQVVGVSTYCRYPPEAARVAKAGTYLNPSIEPILAMKPDLVIIVKNPIQLAARIEALGLRVLEVDQDSIAGIHDAIRRIGRAAGAEREAEALSAGIRGELEAIRRRASKYPPRSAAFIVGRTPATLDGMVAAGDCYLDEIMRVAGGVNVFAGAAAPYPKVSLEEILARDPEVVIDMGEMAETAGFTEERRRSIAALWSRYPALKAVRGRRVFAVSSDIYVVPGPRVVEAAREFARMLHPEEFR